MLGSWPAAAVKRQPACLHQRVLVPPDVVEPVDPLVPELLLVPLVEPLGAVDDEDDGEVVELPEDPMPDEVPDVLLGVEAEALPEGVEIEPLAVPPVEPMPDAVPDVEPVALVPQAARAAADTRMGARIFSMLCSFRSEAGCLVNLQDAGSRRMGGPPTGLPWA
ncbi:hypothetical protein [Ramlibacter algicola]|uniref:Uncharacterized protein n=1 Tax=Ramlibacter algicola TaxID=2795217 RepID=A0A934UPR3_9BURK|nr:hypothetical protein [Ramlibacter algicola]MBK0391031.1 hypothetical protein [Ramlibacter algicola]